MVSYCSLLNDRSLTKLLIENSNNSPSKCFHRFFNTSEWVDDLDIWPLTHTIKKTDISRRNLDFHEDVGLYLPRYDKLDLIPTKNDFICSKEIIPERPQQSFKQEETIYVSDEQVSSSEDNLMTNVIEKPISNEISSNKGRSTLRQVESNNSLQENKSKKNFESINRENFQYLLKEQLSSLFTRETTNISSKRTMIRIPSIQIKHQNLPPKPNPALIMERYSRVQHLVITPRPSQPTTNKLLNSRQSTFILQEIPTLGLTVTPLDFSSSKYLQNSSVEKISHQETRNRPATQPVSLPSSMRQNEEQQKILLKRNIQTGFISASGNFVVSNQNSIDEQTQTNQRFHRHRRSLSKNTIPRAKNFQLLPHIAGKRIDVTFSNRRNS